MLGLKHSRSDPIHGMLVSPKRKTQNATSQKRHFRSQFQNSENSFQHKLPPKTWENHLRNHFRPLESGFSAIATYKTRIFSKIPQCPPMSRLGVIPTTKTCPKIMKPVMVHFTPSHPMCPLDQNTFAHHKMEECDSPTIND